MVQQESDLAWNIRSVDWPKYFKLFTSYAELVSQTCHECSKWRLVFHVSKRFDHRKYVSHNLESMISKLSAYWRSGGMKTHHVQIGTYRKKCALTLCHLRDIPQHTKQAFLFFFCSYDCLKYVTSNRLTKLATLFLWVGFWKWYNKSQSCWAYFVIFL